MKFCTTAILMRVLFILLCGYKKNVDFAADLASVHNKLQASAAFGRTCFTACTMAGLSVVYRQLFQYTYHCINIIVR